ncbi:fungal specific transcription factor domain-containing protein, partial [Candidatus Bathyarchaeota archaeon]|nr:fungal specific transcription factor domain-containing protein [Candidatus Bathyarchaeota archaeon]
MSKTTDIAGSLSKIDQARIVASVITKPSSRATSIYVGESGYGAIFDILRPASPQRRHITVNGTAHAALGSEDLEYLRIKGCFELPAESPELLAAYFRFVHPVFPVLDGPSFSRDLADRGLGGMNLLLLWSMFSVSASYVPAYSGKEVKSTFVRRGKALFDLGGENDKVVLVQSALLLGFWFEDAEDVKQSWYWSGIAFSMAQALGLHRGSTSRAHDLPGTGRDVWGVLWQCCVLRDAWLSYSMGRPLRLDGAACSDTHLQPADCGFRYTRPEGICVYSENEAEGFESMWRASVAAAHAVRQSLSSTPAQAYLLSTSLRNSLHSRQDTGTSVLLSLCSRHLLLCQNAALIAVCQVNGDEETAGAAADR